MNAELVKAAILFLRRTQIVGDESIMMANVLMSLQQMIGEQLQPAQQPPRDRPHIVGE